MLKLDYIDSCKDIFSSLNNYYLWGRMGWAEMRGKYRRTSIGPFWATLSLGFFIFALGQVWSKLWGVELDTFMPYVAAGMVSWVLISAILTDGANCFTKSHSLINSINFPLPLIPFTVTWHHFTLFMHNVIVVVFAGFFYTIELSFSTLLIVPGILLIWLNGIWATLLLGMLGARFRDIQVIVSTVLQMMVFITPIFWTYDQLVGRANLYLVKMNPFLHYIEIIRQPMLGNTPDMYSYFIVLIGTVIGWGVTFIFYSRYKDRVAYWI